MKKIYDIEEKKKIEKECFELGMNLVAGIDEVGRGPLAGPVVCACVIMPKESQIIGVDDSKKLSKKKREELCEKILSEAIDYKIEYVFEDVIDQINILNATKLCMANAIKKLKIKPDIVLVDAVKDLDVSVPTKAFMHGDSLSYTIACASILAKVSRDNFMQEMAQKYPGYGFEKNMGYGTREHMVALRDIGPCQIHRKTFIKFLEENK